MTFPLVFRRPRFAGLRLLVALATLATILVLPSAASAQIALNGAPIHSGTNHPNNASPLMISREDCKEKTTFTFAVTGLVAQKTLSVWATSQGGDCTQSAQRNPGGTQTCYRVADAFIPSAPPSQSLVLTSSAIVNGIETVGAGGVTNCSDATAGDAPRQLVLYFLVDESLGNVTESLSYNIDFDLRGPPPPTQLAPSTYDDATLLVKYCTPVGTTDVAGYRVFCDASGASGAISSSADPECTNTGSSTSTTTTTGAGGSGGAGGTGGTAGTGGTSDASTSSSGGSTDTCTSPSLTPGSIPSGLVECASVSGITAIEAEAPGFVVGQLGAVAIAAYDNVGNLGALSSVVCGQTEPVTDFFEAYRAAGGKAGSGCYCHVGRERASGVGALAFMVGLLVMAWRRVGGAR